MKLFSIILTIPWVLAGTVLAQTFANPEIYANPDPDPAGKVAYEIRIMDWYVSLPNGAPDPIIYTENNPSTPEVFLWKNGHICYEASIEPDSQWASFSDRSEMPVLHVSGAPIVIRDWYGLVVELPGYFPSHGVIDLRTIQSNVVSNFIPMLSIAKAMDFGEYCDLSNAEVDETFDFGNHKICIQADYDTFENGWKFITVTSPDLPFYNYVEQMKVGDFWIRKPAFYWRMAILDENDNFVHSFSKPVTIKLSPNGAGCDGPAGGGSMKPQHHGSPPEVSFYNPRYCEWYYVDCYHSNGWPIAFKTKNIQTDWGINVPEYGGPWNTQDGDFGDPGKGGKGEEEKEGPIHEESLHGDDGDWYWIEVWRCESPIIKESRGSVDVVDGYIIGTMNNHKSIENINEVTTSQTINNQLNGSAGGEANFNFTAWDIKGWMEGSFSNSRVSAEGSSVMAKNAYSTKIDVAQGHTGNPEINGKFEMFESSKETWFKIIVWKYVENGEDELIAEIETDKIKEVTGYSIEYIPSPSLRGSNQANN